MYNFTNFAMSLNELEPGMEAILAPTDCRFRPDIRAMENGNISKWILDFCFHSVCPNLQWRVWQESPFLRMKVLIEMKLMPEKVFML